MEVIQLEQDQFGEGAVLKTPLRMMMYLLRPAGLPPGCDLALRPPPPPVRLPCAFIRRIARDRMHQLACMACQYDSCCKRRKKRSQPEAIERHLQPCAYQAVATSDASDLASVARSWEAVASAQKQQEEARKKSDSEATRS